MAAASGKVALVRTTAALAGACPSDPAIVDEVGYGNTANCFRGTGPTPAPGNTAAVLRASGGCADTQNNALDFVTGIPTPRNSLSPVALCPVTSTSLFITEYQKIWNVLSFLMFDRGMLAARNNYWFLN